MAVSAYFFFGEEMYPAFQHVERLIDNMSSGQEHGPDVERFDLKTHSWPEILDSARSMPLLFSSRRLIVVQFPPRTNSNKPSPYEKIIDQDKKLLKDYFSSPPASTVMVVILPEKLKASSGLIRFFRSLGKNIQIQECKPLKEPQLYPWIRGRLQGEGKRISEEAAQRLIELNGSALGILDQELRKLMIFVGEGTNIDLTHVNEISGWGKEFTDYDIKNELEAGHYKNTVLVIDRLLEKRSVHPVQILNQVAGFMQNILLAKLRLNEGKKDQKAIFREIYPQIRGKYRDLYQRKFDQLFQTVNRLSMEEITELVARLRRVDMKIKSTGLPFQPLIEEWIYYYSCLGRE
jgi:DNA polymerase III delta subunit